MHNCSLGKLKSRTLFVALVIMLSVVEAQEKQERYALVIGNSNYQYLSELNNPQNDAMDISKKLTELDFDVECIIDSNLQTIEEAVVRFGSKLSVSKSNIGFFYYAGHGVQSNGINYLIPCDANIIAESFLRSKAFSVQDGLNIMNEAKNKLTIIVLDACRDNPFSWSRSTARGLSVIGSQPAGSIIVYATSVGNVANDGEGRNGVFTTELLKNMALADVEIKDVFNKTGAAVQRKTNNNQIPAVYNQYFDDFYLNSEKGKEVILEEETESKDSHLVVKKELSSKGYLKISENIPLTSKIYIDSIQPKIDNGIIQLPEGEHDLVIMHPLLDESKIPIVIKKDEMFEISIDSLKLSSMGEKYNDMIKEKKENDKKINENRILRIMLLFSGAIIGSIGGYNANDAADWLKNAEEEYLAMGKTQEVEEVKAKQQSGILTLGFGIGTMLFSFVKPKKISEIEEYNKKLNTEILNLNKVIK